MKYVARDWKYKREELDEFDRPITEVLLDGHGWCRYSWAVDAVLIDGKWIKNWEEFEVSK